MRTGFVLGSVSRNAGGLYDATRRLGAAIHAPPDVSVQIFGLADGDTPDDLDGWRPMQVAAFPPRPPGARWGWSPDLSSAIDAADLDLLHVHGLWMYQSVIGLRRARRGAAVVVSPHGMLDPWALRHAVWKKRAAALLYENAHLRQASCLHALCLSEMQALRDYGLAGPICIAPNGVDLPEETCAPPAWSQCVPQDAKVLLFLGRLHRKKGLDPLLRAWARVEKETCARDWRLVLAGWDDGHYLPELERLIADLEVKRVHVVGPQFGEDKKASYARAQAFILPSFSEGLPMTVLEAWSHNLPVLMTDACHLPEGFVAGAALRIEPRSAELAATLLDFFAASDADRLDMGARGRDLVRREFSWQGASARLRAAYAWILGGGPAPDCVLTERRCSARRRSM